MELVINENNLNFEEVDEFNSKVRAILIDDDNQILIANYGKAILLPGGKVDECEKIEDAIVRELKEELGQDYSIDELDFMTTLKHCQMNYPKRDGNFKNRLVITYYFVGKYKGISNNVQKLTEKEEKGGFKLELVPLNEIENMVLGNQNDNPRNVYFQKEILEIIRFYKNIQDDSKSKKLELK